MERSDEALLHPRAGKGAVLVVADGPGKGRSILVPRRETVTIGRSEAATFTFPDDEKLADRHLSLTLDAVLSITDAGGGGTQVNGARIGDRTTLRVGDLIRAGSLVLEVVESGEPRAARGSGRSKTSERLAALAALAPRARTTPAQGTRLPGPEGPPAPASGATAPTPTPLALPRPAPSGTADAPSYVELVPAELAEPATPSELERLKEELQAASRIQRKLLPSQPPVVPGIELAGRCLPAVEVGGDMYDFFVRGDNLFISIGDVAGKGAGSGMVMATVRALLRAYAQREERTDVVLQDMNRALAGDLEPGQFVSFLLLRFVAKTGDLRYAGAGHEHILLLRATGEVHVLRTGGVVLGLSPEVGKRIRERTLRLNAGDTVVLYTDGATEAVSPSGQELGLRRLAEIVGSAGKNASAAALVEHVVQAVRRFQGDRPPHDDLTVVAARRLSG